jgi:WD repeat and SOF domain-containing protein 1
VKTISRVASECTRERTNDVYVEPRNTDPLLHPFERAREMTRALQATKLERLFAKPFVTALSGHVEGVYCLARAQDSLTRVVSGAADGEVRVWDVRDVGRPTLWTNRAAHGAFVRGVCFVPGSGGSRFWSCGDDAALRLWTLPQPETDAGVDAQTSASVSVRVDAQTPVSVRIGKHNYTAVDHHWGHGLLATASTGAAVELWNYERTDPLRAWSWRGTSDSLTAVRFSPVEQHVLAAAGTDRSVLLCDLRAQGLLGKAVLQMRSNALAWSPMEAFYFATACEDHRAYVFDMRRLDRAVNVLQGHVGAVLDVDYAPTGRELVTAGYDRTLRLFASDAGTARDVYHTGRMQRLFAARFTADAAYVLTGSDDGNVRVWKANAAARRGILSEREKTARNYAEQLRARYAQVPEIRRIATHRRLPKLVRSLSRGERIERDALARREANRRKHARPGSLPEPRTLREQAVLAVRK